MRVLTQLCPSNIVRDTANDVLSPIFVFDTASDMWFMTFAGWYIQWHTHVVGTVSVWYRQ
jgi:uncharacterized protein YfaT (DUF1175 family)